MGRPKTIDDDAVLEAARSVFREFGHQASTRDVAQAAGVSQAVLFQRFGSKDELFFRAMVPERPDLDKLLGEPTEEQDAFTVVLSMAERLRQYLRDFMPTLLQVLAYPGLSPRQLQAWHSLLPFRSILDAFRGRFEELKARGVVDADPEVCAYAVISFAHAVVFFQTLSAPEADAKAQKRHEALQRVLWNGMHTRDGASPRQGRKPAPHPRKDRGK